MIIPSSNLSNPICNSKRKKNLALTKLDLLTHLKVCSSETNHKHNILVINLKTSSVILVRMS